MIDIHIDLLHSEFGESRSVDFKDRVNSLARRTPTGRKVDNKRLITDRSSNSCLKVSLGIDEQIWVCISNIFNYIHLFFFLQLLFAFYCVDQVMIAFSGGTLLALLFLAITLFHISSLCLNNRRSVRHNAKARRLLTKDVSISA